MNKCALLIAVLSLLAGGHVRAQTSTDKKQDAGKDKQETVEKTDKPAPPVKVVPSAKSRHAKPEKVNSAKPRTARPGGTRPARNARPSARPVRPGNGRH